MLPKDKQFGSKTNADLVFEDRDLDLWHPLLVEDLFLADRSPLSPANSRFEANPRAPPPSPNLNVTSSSDAERGVESTPFFGHDSGIGSAPLPFDDDIRCTFPSLNLLVPPAKSSSRDEKVPFSNDQQTDMDLLDKLLVFEPPSPSSASIRQGTVSKTSKQANAKAGRVAERPLAEQCKESLAQSVNLRLNDRARAAPGKTVSYPRAQSPPCFDTRKTRNATNMNTSQGYFFSVQQGAYPQPYMPGSNHRQPSHIHTAERASPAMCHPGLHISRLAAPIRRGKKPRNKARKWSADEQQRFEEGLDMYGRDWEQIARHVGTRDISLIRSHAQKHFIKLAKHDQPLPRRVLESGDGYTLSGNPLRPDGPSARSYLTGIPAHVTSSVAPAPPPSPVQPKRSTGHLGWVPSCPPSEACENMHYANVGSTVNDPQHGHHPPLGACQWGFRRGASLGGSTAQGEGSAKAENGNSQLMGQTGGFPGPLLPLSQTERDARKR